MKQVEDKNENVYDDVIENFSRSKAGKRKTKVKKHTLNPVFEEILKVSRL